MDNKTKKVQTGFSELYSIKATRINNLKECFSIHGFHVTCAQDKNPDIKQIQLIEQRFRDMFEIPFIPNELRNLTNSEKDGYKGMLPYSSYVQISEEKGEVLGVYFQQSFKKTPFIFIHYKPEDGKIILANYMDFETASILENDELFEIYKDELRKPNKIDKMIAGIEEMNKIIKTYSLIEAEFKRRKQSDIFEIELDYIEEER